MENAEPLLVNTKGSWDWRPDAVIPEIKNFFLAADYVRTYTDLATMESANEAARRAVNGILAASGSRKGRCKLWPLKEPLVFAPAQLYDSLRWHWRWGHDPKVVWFALAFIVPLWCCLRLAWKACYFFSEHILAPIGRLFRRRG
jgi:hypothetical protein